MQFSYPDWSKVHTKYWEKLFNQRLNTVDPITMVEVGCFEGRSTLFFANYLKHNVQSRLICIDTWAGGEEIEREKLDFNMNIVESNFHNNIDQHPHRDQISVYKEPSEVMLSEFLFDYYRSVDFIYLDGSHTQRDTLVDLTLSLLLIKKGGMIIVDDYLNQMATKIKTLRPQAAVDFVVKSFGNEVKFMTTPESQAVIIRK